MRDNDFSSLARLADDELIARVKTLAAREREATALLVAHLAELEARGLHLQAGYGSLFVYCREALGLSEHEAYNRIEVARAARRFPVILEKLAQGAVHLTSVRLLAPHLTLENHQHLLESARGKRRVEVEAIVARLQPRPDVPASVRKLPAPTPGSAEAARLLEAVPAAPRSDLGEVSTPVGPRASRAPVLPAPVVPVPGPLPAAPLPSARPARLEPLSPGRFKLQVTIGEETLEKLRLAQDLLRHAVPSGNEAEILDRALTALLADLAKKKFAATAQPRPARRPVGSSGTSPGSRHIPAEVRRVVWLRDLGRCAFVGTTGRRCHDRAFLEFHHVRPYAVGGEATIENVQLRCFRHSLHEARLCFADVGRVRESVRSYGASTAQASLEATRFETSTRPDARDTSPTMG